MATLNKTDKELKVIVTDAETDKLSAYLSLPDKTGTVYFDKVNKAVFYDGLLVSSNVKNVDITQDGLLTITYYEGATKSINLSIDEELNALKTTIEYWAEGLFATSESLTNVNTNLGNKISIVEESLQTNSSEISGIKNSVSEIKDDNEDQETRLTTAEQKLLTIAEGAQVNTIGTILAKGSHQSANQVIPQEESKRILFQGNLVDNGNSSTGKIDFNLTVVEDGHDVKFYGSDMSEPIYTLNTGSFIIDGMVDNVYVDQEAKQLVVKFNTASGKNEIRIPLVDLLPSSIVESVNGISGAVTITAEQIDIDSSGAVYHHLIPIVVDTPTLGSGSKTFTLRVNPDDIMYLFFQRMQTGTTNVKIRDANIEESSDEDKYSMSVDFATKKWKF